MKSVGVSNLVFGNDKYKNLLKVTEERWNGSKSSIDILFDKKLSACISDNDNVEVVYNIPSSIAAPVNNECIIGNVCVNINDKEIQRYNIYCNENIKKVSFISKITQKVKKL